MIPSRQKLIGKNKVKQYYWGGKLVVYINNKAVNETYDQAVTRLERES